MVSKPVSGTRDDALLGDHLRIADYMSATITSRGFLRGPARVFSRLECYRFDEAIVATWGGQNAAQTETGKTTILDFPEGVYAT
jgi:hypothetical protein